MPLDNVVKMIFALQCPECKADDGWTIEINAGADKWTHFTGFSCRCGHHIIVEPIPVKQGEK